jgi:hypothetical protein
MSKLTLGGGPAGNPGFSFASPYYRNRKYHNGGFVWLKKRPATMRDMQAFIEWFEAQTGQKNLADKLAFDSLSLRGKNDPKYSSAWDLSNSRMHAVYGKRLSYKKIVALTTPVTRAEAKPYIQQYRAERRAGQLSLGG